MWLIVFIIIILCLRMLMPIEFLSVSKSIDSFMIIPNLNEFTGITISKGTDITIAKMLYLIWVLGFLFFLLRYIFKYHLFVRKFRFIPKVNDKHILAIVESIKEQYNFGFGINIISNKLINSPSEFGLLNKTILIDIDRYNDEELYYIFLHEMIHFYNRTNWIKLIMNIIVSIFWWDPVIYLLRDHIDNLLEVYVDKFISKTTGANIEYLQCIASVLRKSEKVAFNNHFVKPMAANFLLKRAKLLTINIRNSKLIGGSVLIILVLYLFISGVYVIQPAYEPPEEDLVVPDLNSSNSYIVKEDDIYVLYYEGIPFLKNIDPNVLPDIPIIEK